MYPGSEKEKIKNRRLYHKNKYKFPAFSRGLYFDQRRGSEKRGHPYPPYTLDEFREWLLANSFDILFDRFEQSGYDKWLRPSADRIDSSLPYTFDNLQLITWRKNHKKNKY